MGKFHQRGMGIAGWIFVILIIGAGASVGSQLIPVYMDNGTVVNVLKALQNEPGHGSKHDAGLKDLIEKRLKVNSIRDFPIDERLKIERDRRGTTLILDYEVRMDLIQNLDLVASFSETVELRD